MRSHTAATIVILVVLSLMPPVSAIGGDDGPGAGVLPALRVQEVPAVTSIDFPEPIDTSENVSDFALIARALMLPGGSTDALLHDINGDGYSDMIVAVSGDAKAVSIFYGSSDGVFGSYPSHNISLSRNPIALGLIDMGLNGNMSIVVLERRNSDADMDYFQILSFVSNTSYLSLTKSLYNNPITFVSGNFTGNSSMDLAFACPGTAPLTDAGSIIVVEGPDFVSMEMLDGGMGSNSIRSADFNDDGIDDVALANYYENSIYVYLLVPGAGLVHSKTLTLTGSPTDIVVGELNNDSYADLCALTHAPNGLSFFFQTVSGLPTTPLYSRSLVSSYEVIRTGDLNDDSWEDLILLSQSANRAAGMLQIPELPWGTELSFEMPTGSIPRGAVCGHFDSDLLSDLAIASARADWSGSSLSVYFQRDGGFSNSNRTTWSNTNWVASAAESGDLNGDDTEDLVLLHPSIGSFGYALDFSSETDSIALGYAPTILRVEDLDLDGLAEVLAAEEGSTTLTLNEWDLDDPGSFVRTDFILSDSLSDLELADLNNDSLTDIAAAAGAGEIQLFLNAGGADVFSPSPDLILPVLTVPGWTLCTGDFNSDGLQDIAYPAPDCKIDILLQREVQPLFSSEPDVTLFHTWPEDFTELWGGDLTGDRKTDIAGRATDGLELRFFDQTDFLGTPYSYAGLALPQVPSFLMVSDLTDDGYADLAVAFDQADLVFLYKQYGGAIPSVPSMVFVSGASPSWVTIGDSTQDHRGDLLVCDSESHTVSAWEMYNRMPVAHAGGPYLTRQGDPLTLNGSVETGYSELPYMEFRWDFGDGTPMTDWAREPNPVHVYMEMGVFDIFMEARDPDGLTSNDTTYVTVMDSYPHPDFTWLPLNPVEGQEVTLYNDTYSFDPVVQLGWFLDGMLVHEGLDPVVVLGALDDGDHVVTLSATDSDGSVANATKTLYVQPLTPELLVVAPELVDEGVSVLLEVMVDPSHEGPVDAVASVEWNYSYTGGPFVPEESTGPSNATYHTFSASGDSVVYTVAVRVTDVDGDWNVTYFNIEVVDIGPSASFTLTTDTPSEGVSFSFLDSTYSFDGVESWYWEIAKPDSSVESFYLDAAAMALHQFVLGDGMCTMSLDVQEADGDNDSFSMQFEVLEIAPFVTLSLLPHAPPYDEFESVTFSVSVESYDPVDGYAWDFDSSGPQFVSDAESETGEISHAYLWAGTYTAKVMVTDEDGSSGIESVEVQVEDLPLTGSFEDDVSVTREDPEHTSVVTFNASSLADRFPDISNTLWEFGDGDGELILTGPHSPVAHEYEPVRDYQANLTITDDDGNVLTVSTVLRMVEPAIVLRTPANGSVIRSGTPVSFIVSDDTLPLVFVRYSLNGGEFRDFETLYEVETDDWPDGMYRLDVMAGDKDGNTAIRRDVTVTIDDTPPTVKVDYINITAYGGDALRISVNVTEPNIAPGGVTLHVWFPGSDVPLVLVMEHGLGDEYFAVFEAPKRAGTIEFYVIANDMAGNSITSSSYSIEVRLHFIDAAWPYLLVIAAAMTASSFAYLMRETKIAVDETFVIYTDGRMLAHSTRRLKPGMDDQILSGMFVAIQDFIKDSFKDETSFTLRKLDFGERSVLVEKGKNIYLAVILHGKASRKVAHRMKTVVKDIEGRFGEHLDDWDGDLDKVRGVNEMVKKLYSKAPALPAVRAEEDQ